MKKWYLSFAVLIAFLFLITIPVMAAEPSTETEQLKGEVQKLLNRIQELEKKQAESEAKTKETEKKIESVEKAATKVEQEEAAIKEKKATPVSTFWKNDFYLETPDSNFSMRIRGNLHFDTKFYGGNSKTPTQFDIRRARIDFQGLFWKYIQFRVQPELADSPYIRNAWVDYKFRDWLHLMAGQMKPPFSTSWWTMDNNVNFLERGSTTPVYPYFDRGVWLWGDVLNNTLTWNASMWTGAGLELDYPKGDIDDHKDIVARLFFSPFKNNKGHVLEGLHLCLEGTYSNQSIPTSRFETKGMSTQIRDSGMWKWKTQSSSTTAEIGQRNRWGAELHYIKGPISFSSEYLVTEYKDIEVYNTGKTTKGLDENGKITSWSTWVSYFLTGESNTVSNFGWRKPNPKVDFDPIKLKGSGAWEILARYTHTDVSDNLFASNTIGTTTYTILDGAPWTDEYTAGVSWTWNPLVRWQLNYTHITAGGDGLFSGATTYLAGEGQSQNEDMVGMRMIFKF